MLGLGRDRVVRIPVDGQGRMIAAQIPAIEGPTIVCTQAGNINSGAFDPIGEVCDAVKPAGAWVHVDGSFGLWVAASPEQAHLIEGMQNVLNAVHNGSYTERELEVIDKGQRNDGVGLEVA